MSYRVSFFKNLLSTDGHQFRCLQQSIVIRRARSVERAVEAAKRRLNDTAMRLIGDFTRTALSWRWINDHVCI
jgi:hypothetical protein